MPRPNPREHFVCGNPRARHVLPTRLCEERMRAGTLRRIELVNVVGGDELHLRTLRERAPLIKDEAATLTRARSAFDNHKAYHGEANPQPRPNDCGLCSAVYYAPRVSHRSNPSSRVCPACGALQARARDPMQVSPRKSPREGIARYASRSISRRRADPCA